MNEGRSPGGPAPVEIEIRSDDDAWRRMLPDAERVVEDAARAALAEAGFSRPAELCVVLTDDAAVRVLNRDWRSKDRPTNVLSFPASDAPAPSHHLADRPDIPLLLGDIVLAAETCAREAQDGDRPLSHHLAHLVVHGVMHLLGHDHEADDEAEEMEAAEVRALARLGIPNPYSSDGDTS